MAIRLAEDLARELEDLDLPLRPGAAGPGLLQLLFDAAQLLVRRSAAQPALESLEFPLRQRELLLPLLRFGLKALDRRGIEPPKGEVGIIPLRAGRLQIEERALVLLGNRGAGAAPEDPFQHHPRRVASAHGLTMARGLSLGLFERGRA